MRSGIFSHCFFIVILLICFFAGITNNDDKIRALNFLVLMLPIEHRNTYRVLLQFFLNIIKHVKENRMNLHNVAMITAPSFFPPRLLLPK